MAEAREIVGAGPVYVTYDIDFVDPTFAPGTGTPEVGGPTSWQALQVARGLRGLDVVGADLVEVSPPFDASGGTARLPAGTTSAMRSPAIKTSWSSVARPPTVSTTCTDWMTRVVPSGGGRVAHPASTAHPATRHPLASTENRVIKAPRTGRTGRLLCSNAGR